MIATADSCWLLADGALPAVAGALPLRDRACEPTARAASRQQPAAFPIAELVLGLARHRRAFGRPPSTPLARALPLPTGPSSASGPQP